MRIIALDVGTKNIGVALSDPLGITAQSLPTLRRKGDTAAEAAVIAGYIEEYGCETLVVGLPRNMNGSEGPSCEMARWRRWSRSPSSFGMNGSPPARPSRP